MVGKWRIPNISFFYHGTRRNDESKVSIEFSYYHHWSLIEIMFAVFLVSDVFPEVAPPYFSFIEISRSIVTLMKIEFEFDPVEKCFKN